MKSIFLFFCLAALPLTALSAPEIMIYPANLDFGDVVKSTSDFELLVDWDGEIGYAVLIHNAGDADLQITSMAIGDPQFTFSTGEPSFFFPLPTFPFTLAAGERRFIPVSFTPDIEGQVISSLVITSFDPVNSEVTVPLTGNGIEYNDLVDFIDIMVDGLLVVPNVKGQLHAALNQVSGHLNIPPGANQIAKDLARDAAIDALETFIDDVDDNTPPITASDAKSMKDEALYIINLLTFFGINGANGSQLEAIPLPLSIYISDAYPNPFNSTTTIRYAIPEATEMRLSVFDLSGCEVALLAEGNMQAGFHNVVWAADGVAAGLYFVRLEVGGKTATQKLTLLK